jgi:RNA polymerase sigma-70 factor (ECF subfamily)
LTPSDRPPPRPSGPPAEAAETVRDQHVADRRVHEAYERWSADIRAFLLGLTRNADEAEDLLQATFGRLVESGAEAGTSSLRGWLFRVAHNEVMLARRKAGVRGRGLESAGRSAESRGRFAGAPPAWAALVQAEDVARVRAALRSLPPEQRHVVERRIYQGRTFAEIAAEAGLPLGTVLTRMRLARQTLERALGRPE